MSAPLLIGYTVSMMNVNVVLMLDFGKPLPTVSTVFLRLL